MEGARSRTERTNLAVSTKISDLLPDFQPFAKALIEYANQYVPVRVTSTLRSYAEQQRLYDLRTAGQWPFPVAAPGTSAHEYGYAMDLELPSRGDYTALGSVWTSWGGVYGGSRDYVHYEFPGFTAPSPAAASVGGVPADYGTPGSALDQLVDAVLGFLGPVGRILSTGYIASLIWQAAGGSEPTILFWATHPVEFLRDFYALWGALIRAEIGI